MGCCSSSKSTIKNVKKPIFKQDSLQSENSSIFIESQEKNKEQSQEQETCAKPSLNKKKTNQLICFQVQQDNIQNKDNLNAVDDEFFESKNQSNIYKIEKRNSDSDY
ncbi:unnamed protein product (macronuclear) [Paramecium tetraurelia]|uniref:Uncharacterized protein n=1 Tax=Paramecium tetraurelia TaxID=5888 RepID=A0BV10_PARTE|nr:uncharacterized protein GSPATT00005623001 [Paramecium tetraurelia]CAK62377.1 unnamed protein product [Paramecium tetraurelia]|eukprot:XP_001429775.1 hypothetical protein (macronuclear) [Paramecium tetraurelia strain d4-2]